MYDFKLCLAVINGYDPVIGCSVDTLIAVCHILRRVCSFHWQLHCKNAAFSFFTLYGYGTFHQFHNAVNDRQTKPEPVLSCSIAKTVKCLEDFSCLFYTHACTVIMYRHGVYSIDILGYQYDIS